VNADKTKYIFMYLYQNARLSQYEKTVDSSIERVDEGMEARE